MKDTCVEKNLIMHIQDRNLHGKVFGGYLMRHAYELGWMCAMKHLNGRVPKIFHIDDIIFKAPVEIGSILRLKARVVYV
jgi:acyl-coenzyme A thioesterase 9